jgi:rhodanese-related sulfurtransferase
MNGRQEYYEKKLKFEIDAWDLNESLIKGEKIKVIDTRSNASYLLEHIAESINIPHREMSEEKTKNLDKDFLYITYCDGIGCNASTKGALNMAKLGFKVKEFIGGLDWWKRDGYHTEGDKTTEGKQIECGC